jgi:hypothetical protein
MVWRTVNFIDNDGLHEHYKLRTLEKCILFVVFIPKMLSPFRTETKLTWKQATFSCLPAVNQTVPTMLSTEGWVPAILCTKITLIWVLFVVVVAAVTGSRLSANLWFCASRDSHLASHLSRQHSYRFRPTVFQPRDTISCCFPQFHQLNDKQLSRRRPGLLPSDSYVHLRNIRLT